VELQTFVFLCALCGKTDHSKTEICSRLQVYLENIFRVNASTLALGRQGATIPPMTMPSHELAQAEQCGGCKNSVSTNADPYQLPQEPQDSPPDRDSGTVSRRFLIKSLVIAALCVLPAVCLLRRPRPMTQTITFFKPDEQFGRYAPSANDDDRKKLRMTAASNDFIAVKEVGFIGYVDDYDVFVQLEFVGKMSKDSYYQIELQVLDEHGEVLASSWNETQDIRVVTQKKNESEYAKKYGSGFLPVYCVNLGTGISEEVFNRIVKVNLTTSAVLG